MAILDSNIDVCRCLATLMLGKYHNVTFPGNMKRKKKFQNTLKINIKLDAELKFNKLGFKIY